MGWAWRDSGRADSTVAYSRRVTARQEWRPAETPDAVVFRYPMRESGPTNPSARWYAHGGLGSARRGDSDLVFWRCAAPPWGKGTAHSVATRGIRARIPAAAHPTPRHLTRRRPPNRFVARVATEWVLAHDDRGFADAGPRSVFSRADPRPNQGVPMTSTRPCPRTSSRPSTNRV